MDIDAMHSTFRVLGQQMGMQLVRGILPESIDTFINAEIGELIQNQLLTNAHTVLQEDVNLQSMTMSPINFFRTLYRKDKVELKKKTGNNKVYKNFVNASSSIGSFKILIPNTVNRTNKPYFKTTTDQTTEDADLGIETEVKINPMLYLGVSLESDSKITPCRLIGASALETTLRDYCNGADKNNPIAVLLGETRSSKIDSKDYDYNCEYFEIYTNTNNYSLDNIHISYIKYPNVVKWDSTPANRVDCDLPEYIHYKIIEGAVKRFHLSIGKISNAEKQ